MIDEKIISKMRNASSFDTQSDVDEFLYLLDQLDITTNPSYLNYLFEFLRDDCDIEGVDESLRLAIEDCSVEYYVPNLLKSLKNIYNKAPDQCEYLFWTIFNTPEDLNVLKKSMHLADKETLLKLFDKIYKDEYSLPEHKTIVNKLRNALGNAK